MNLFNEIGNYAYSSPEMFFSIVLGVVFLLILFGAYLGLTTRPLAGLRERGYWANSATIPNPDSSPSVSQGDPVMAVSISDLFKQHRKMWFYILGGSLLFGIFINVVNAVGSLVLRSWVTGLIEIFVLLIIPLIISLLFTSLSTKGKICRYSHNVIL